MQEHPFANGDEASSAIILPDFGTQNYAIPPIRRYDLTSPGITYVPEFTADPELEGYKYPFGLDVSTQGMDSDPQIAHDIPTSSEVASSLYPGLGFSTLDVLNSVTDEDPLLPDMQNPDLTPQRQMPVDERPGNMDPSVLDIISYQQSPDTHYPEVWMDQHGMNTTRSRHLSLLDHGLER